MKKSEIAAIYSSQVAKAIAAGWRINPWTMNGSQGEICKCHFEKDGVLMVIYMDNFSNWSRGDKPRTEGIKIVTGYMQKGSWGNGVFDTIWLDKLESQVAKYFYRLGDSRDDDWFVETEDEAIAAINVAKKRYIARKGDDETCYYVVKDMPAVLKIVRGRIKGCKTIKAGQIRDARFVLNHYTCERRELVVNLGDKGIHSITFNVKAA